MLRAGSTSRARAFRLELVATVLTGSVIWAAMAPARFVADGTVLVRRIDWVNESASEFRSVVSLVQVDRSTLRTIGGSRIPINSAITASTPISSIMVQARWKVRTGKCQVRSDWGAPGPGRFP